MTAQSLQRNEPLGFQRYGALVGRILQWIVFGYQAAAVIIFSWPVPGKPLANSLLSALLQHTLVFNNGPQGLNLPGHCTRK